MGLSVKLSCRKKGGAHRALGQETKEGGGWEGGGGTDGRGGGMQTSRSAGSQEAVGSATMGKNKGLARPHRACNSLNTP